MSAVIIYGPQGCGKTRNGPALAEHFGKRWISDYDGRRPSQYPAHALVLTSDATVEGAIPFHRAMQEAGLQS
jgi:MoxR-like ATPase